MTSPGGYKPVVIKNSTERMRSTRKGYRTPSNMNINTISNANDGSNISYKNGVKQMLGNGHQSHYSSGNDYFGGHNPMSYCPPTCPPGQCCIPKRPSSQRNNQEGDLQSGCGPCGGGGIGRNR